MVFQQVVTIALMVEQHSEGFLTVASRPSGFLVIGFERIGDVEVNHKTHIWLIDTHAERVGCHNHPDMASLPGCLLAGPFGRFQTSVVRSEEHTSELQSLMRISYAVFCLKKKKQRTNQQQ